MTSEAGLLKDLAAPTSLAPGSLHLLAYVAAGVLLLAAAGVGVVEFAK